jgi:3-mercaptopyruvate sulfurtransferase SseA
VLTRLTAVSAALGRVRVAIVASGVRAVAAGHVPGAVNVPLER